MTPLGTAEICSGGATTEVLVLRAGALALDPENEPASISCRGAT